MAFFYKNVLITIIMSCSLVICVLSSLYLNITDFTFTHDNSNIYRFYWSDIIVIVSTKSNWW